MPRSGFIKKARIGMAARSMMKGSGLANRRNLLEDSRFHADLEASYREHVKILGERAANAKTGTEKRQKLGAQRVAKKRMEKYGRVARSERLASIALTKKLAEIKARKK